jgi:hypothetical protein
MRKWLILLLVLALCGCAAPVPVTTAPETSIPETMLPETTVPETTVPATTAPTEPLHSSLYREGFEVEEILTYFQEVTNQIEYTDGTGDPSLIQKWLTPMVYRIHGSPTEEDLQVLAEFCDQLNAVPGFPGIREAQEDEFENLTLSFLDPDSFRERFSDVVQGEDAWGATQYWYYTATNEIYSAAIGYRTDIPQADRSSIILEEIVNTLGISDSGRRSDSIVYQDSNENLCLSPVDWLILKLLYHPDMECSMDAAECESVIRELYY